MTYIYKKLNIEFQLKFDKAGQNSSKVTLETIP